MPSSGWGMVDIIKAETPEEYNETVKVILRELNEARKHSMEIEWLSCFISAFNKGATPVQCAIAGGQEWDF